MAGEEKAWAALIEQYKRLVWALLGKFANLSLPEKEDLFQDVFVVLLDKGLKSFRGSTTYEFRSYLKIITANEAKSYLRRHGRRFEVLDPFLLTDETEGETLSSGARSVDPAPGPEELVAQQEVWQRVRLCLQDISPLDQEVFWMRERGRSYAEITKDLDLRQGTVASKYHRVKAKIEECLKKAGIL
ncbi:MAG: RNA polymerase sigma factor [Candidatus Binatia bacterium]